MYSMTGYGKAEYSENGLEIIVEMKSVNNRFLDFNGKYPRAFVSFEDAIRKTVQSKLARGRVDMFVTLNDNREREVSLSVDEALAKAYVKAAEKIFLETGVENDLTASVLMRMPNVVSEDAEKNEEDLKDLVLKLVSEACDNLNQMRKTEGEKLEAEILSHLSVIEKTVDKIKARAPEIKNEYREKLKARIEEFLEDVKYDETRLLNEVAFFADKSNIDEEIARLYSHISQFKKICEGELAGRKLDFLVQEFNREANTVCSKANDAELTSYALELKCEIEKIREQIQNLE